jgi:hypothetical protein
MAIDKKWHNFLFWYFRSSEILAMSRHRLALLFEGWMWVVISLIHLTLPDTQPHPYPLTHTHPSVTWKQCWNRLENGKPVKLGLTGPVDKPAGRNYTSNRWKTGEKLAKFFENLFSARTSPRNGIVCEHMWGNMHNNESITFNVKSLMKKISVLRIVLFILTEKDVKS